MRGTSSNHSPANEEHACHERRNDDERQRCASIEHDVAQHETDRHCHRPDDERSFDVHGSSPCTSRKPPDEERDQEWGSNRGDAVDGRALVVVTPSDCDEDDDRNDVDDRCNSDSARHDRSTNPPSWPRKNSNGAGCVSSCAWSIATTSPMTK